MQMGAWFYSDLQTKSARSFMIANRGKFHWISSGCQWFHGWSKQSHGESSRWSENLVNAMREFRFSDKIHVTSRTFRMEAGYYAIVVEKAYWSEMIYCFGTAQMAVMSGCLAARPLSRSSSLLKRKGKSASPWRREGASGWNHGAI